MRITPLESRIETLARPIAAEMGLEIVCARMIGEGGSRSLQVMAEDPATGQIGIEQCAALSRSLSAILDVEDIVQGSYRLEISSPGIDRPLIRLEDFIVYQGHEAKIETDSPNAQGQKRFKGILEGVLDNMIQLQTEQGPASIAYETIRKAKLVLTDRLLKAPANAKHVTQA
ncbi:MAG: ribosome maturation factor RimP [Alphaproteobacteria bacterium]|nr:ribosome maturation factor RimP [Alphaproteobacteria bacterium]